MRLADAMRPVSRAPCLAALVLIEKETTANSKQSKGRKRSSPSAEANLVLKSLCLPCGVVSGGRALVVSRSPELHMHSQLLKWRHDAVGSCLIANRILFHYVHQVSRISRFAARASAMEMAPRSFAFCSVCMVVVAKRGVRLA